MANMKTRRCIICFDKFLPVSSPYLNQSGKELFQIFCKYMKIRRKLEVPGLTFCEKCCGMIETLSLLDGELEKILTQVTRITANCAATIIETFGRTRLLEDQTTVVGLVRADVFSCYSPKVRVTAEPSEADGLASPLHDANDYSEIDLNFPELVMELGSAEEVTGQTSSMDNQPKFAISINDSNTSRPRRVAKSKASKKLQLVAQFQESCEKLPEKLSECIPAAMNKSVYKELSPGKFIYRDKYIFAKTNGKYHCETCGHLAPLLRKMLLHIRKSHEFNGAKRWRYKLVELGKNTFLYANKYKVVINQKKYCCPDCSYTNGGKLNVIDHIYMTHIDPQPTENEENITGKIDEAGTGPTMTGDTDQAAEANGSLFMDAVSDMEETTVVQDQPVSAGDETLKIEATDTCGSEPINAHSKVSEEEEQSDSSVEFYTDPEFIPEELVDIPDQKPRRQKTYKELSPGKFIFEDKFKFEKTEDDQFTCSTCFRKTKDKQAMLNHVRKCHFSRQGLDRKYLKFEAAGENTFRLGQDFTVQKLVDGSYQCSACSLSTENLKKMREHIRYKHMRKEVEKETFMCEECGKTLMTLKSLQLHMERLHSTEAREANHVCETCGRAFVDPKYLQRHIKVHTGALKKNFVCEYCGKKFYSRTKLRSHVTVHTGERPFECQYCNATFRQYNTMTAHRKSCRTGQLRKPTDRVSAPEPSSISGPPQSENPIPTLETGPVSNPDPTCAPTVPHHSQPQPTFPYTMFPGFYY